LLRLVATLGWSGPRAFLDRQGSPEKGFGLAVAVLGKCPPHLAHLRQDFGDFADFRLIWHEELTEILEILMWQDM
jgi:hypothetical protein